MTTSPAYFISPWILGRWSKTWLREDPVELAASAAAASAGGDVTATNQRCQRRRMSPLFHYRPLLSAAFDRDRRRIKPPRRRHDESTTRHLASVTCCCCCSRHRRRCWCSRKLNKSNVICATNIENSCTNCTLGTDFDALFRTEVSTGKSVFFSTPNESSCTLAQVLKCKFYHNDQT